MLGAIFGGASKILGGIAASKAAKARNAAARREYERQLDIRKRGWFQQLSVYGAKVNKYTTQLNENDLAANRGYAQAQAALGAQQSKALAQSEGKFIKFVNQKLGKTIASGATGRSAARLEMMDFAAFGREQANLAFKLTRSAEAYQSNVESIRNQQKSARNKLFGDVMFTPVASVPPNPPTMENTSMPILQGFLGAAAGFANAAGSDSGTPGGGSGISERGGFGTDISGRDFDSGDFGYGDNYIYSPEGWD